MICVPITSKTVTEAINEIKKAENVADIIELRVDYLKNPDIKALLDATKKQVIVTCREKSEGGLYDGDEKGRVELLLNAIAAGADYVDIELSTPEPLIEELKTKQDETRLILSYHNFQQVPEDLQITFDRMIQKGCELIKIVVMANSIEDNLKIFDIIEQAKEKKINIIAFCMGEYGEISRILSPIFGSYLTFASLSRGKESAPGQIPVDILKNIYRVNGLSSDANIYGLIGNPVKESMGYLIHNRSFASKKLNNIYLPFLVDNLSSFISGYRKYFKGMSVTMPFKEQVIPLLDEIDRTAEKIGAVNTLQIREGKLFGCNTDCSGAVKALEEKTDLKGKKVLMIGAGGVARAIGFGIMEKGAGVYIFDVDTQKADALAADLRCRTSSLESIGSDLDILINCSPVGMHPHIDKTPFSKEKLKKEMIVFDAVYNPLKTRLLKEAEDTGCVTIEGIELFVNQAVDQFQLWTGEKAPKELMKEIVLDKLQS
tara:strand:- start:5993 stop:7453 length:1461 start_codon:yes stop_codon:yes gene_type:complete